MTTACWNAFMLPLSLAFEPDTTATTVIDILVDICFFADMIINFRTTYVDVNGEEIFDQKKIADQYY